QEPLHRTRILPKPRRLRRFSISDARFALFNIKRDISASIADLTLLKHGATMIVTGKGFGETNFIALDGDGSPLLQSLIRVVGGKNALLVQRGLDRQSYSCAPQCLPTAKLGDDLKYFGEISGQVKDHNAQATGLQ
ncbi:MAG: pilus assembly protein N-terminal domain-containing protein, partial [Methylocella sp.]